MRQGTSNSTGKWWASAGCAGLVIASAFIGATLYLGGPPTVGSSGPPALGTGPDPVRQASPGPSLVRRKGSPLWPTTTTDDSVTDLAEEESEGFVVSSVRSTTHRPSSTASATQRSSTTTTHRSSTTANHEPSSTSTHEPSSTSTHEPSTTSTHEPSTSSTHEPSSSATTKRTGHHRHRAVKERPQSIDWDEIIQNVNRSVSPGLTQRLRDIANLDPATLIRNTSSLVSFGLLAVDLFLLHNVQRIAFTETAGKHLSHDPEVVALNSLFDGVTGSGERQEQQRGVVGEVVGFLQGAVRGVMNLGRAYRKAHAPRARSVGSPTPLDCIWTLYCRNLDKTANLAGPYGFLARINSLGLRLMLGEFAAEDALERLMTDMSTRGGRLDCNTLFPRCGAEEAMRVVLATAQGKKD